MQPQSREFLIAELEHKVFGNACSTTADLLIEAGSEGATNQLTGVSGSINASVAYNANGNLVLRAGQGFTFDIGNRLTSAVNVASYAYDGLGRRSWAQMANGRTVLRVYSQDGRLLFTNDSLKGATRHIHLGDKVVAETNTLSGTRWLHSDALGSPVASTGPAGQLLDRTRYEPYGLTAAGTNPDGIGFTGHVNDVDTGLVYMQQRYYDPVAGRFLSVDPVTADAKTGNSFNRYVYGNNNPYRFKDPDGRQAVDLPRLEHPIVSVLRDIAAGAPAAPPQAPTVATGTVSKMTLTIGIVEVSRTSSTGGTGSTFVGLRATPGLAVQTSAEGQAKLGETGGLTVKVSASAGLGAAGLTGSVAASVGSSGPGLQVSGGGIGVANASGGILGVRAPTVAVGFTFNDDKPK